MTCLLPVSLSLRAAVLVVAIGLAGAPLAQAQTCSGTDPGGAASTHGLYAEYYSGYYNDNQAYFTNNPRKLARIDTAANFQTSASFGDLITPGVTTAGTATNPDLFSARYRGSFYAPTSTTYTFYINSDDASAMWIDNDALTTPPLISRAIINNGGLHAAATVQASIFLTTGFHNLLLHYGENFGENIFTLEFSTSTISRRFVPSRLLCSAVQPTGFSPTGLVYSPTLVTVLSGTTGTSPVPTFTRDPGDTAPAVYGLLNAPSGITIDPATGVITVAAGTAPGNYTLSVLVTTSGATSFSNIFTFSVVANPNAACAGTDAGSGPAANGLYAKYYAGYFNDVQSFFTTTTESITRIDPQLNYATSGGWGNIVPPASNTAANPDIYSARYKGSLVIGTAGTYTLSLTSDDASYLWLDNPARRTTMLSAEALINNGGVHATQTVSATVALTAGNHDLVVHFGEQAGENVLVMAYSGPDTGNSSIVVPATAFCSSTTGAPLPVVLTRFAALPAPMGVALTWQTAQELNNAYFAVERAIDGKIFGEVLRVAGAGTTSQPQTYEALDRAPLAGLAYYRLRLVDHDGTTTYSPIVAVTMTTKRPAITGLVAQVMPNPALAAGPLTLRVQQEVAVPVQLTITDLQGRVLHRQVLPAALVTELPLALPALRGGGVYLLRLNSATSTITQKLVVQ